MKKLDLYILKSFIRPFAITFIVMVLFLLMQFVWKYIDDLVGKGVEWYYIAELLMYFAAQMVPMAIPLSVLLSSLMTFGTLGEHNELVAIKASGISLTRMLKILSIVVIFIATGSFMFNNYVIPVTNLKGETLLRNISRKKPALNIKPGVFYNGIEGYSIKIGNKEGKNGNELSKILIYDHTDKMGNIKVVAAERGEMKITDDDLYLTINLYDGYSYEEMQPAKRSEREKNPFTKNKFKASYIRFDLSSFKAGDLRESDGKDFTMLNVKQLVLTRDSIDSVYQNRKNEYTEMMVDRFAYGLDSSATEAYTELSDTLTQRLSHVEKQNALQNATRLARSNLAYYEQQQLEYHWREKQIARYNLERYKKFSAAGLAFILFFIGAPLGAIIRKGGLGMPVVISVIIFIIQHVTTFTMEKLGRELVWTEEAAILTPMGVFIPIAIFLTYKSSTDSSLLQSDAYLRWIDKLKTRFARFIKKKN